MIDEDGFCTEGCRFGENAGCWTCPKCSTECEDCEFCQKCEKEKEEEEKEEDEDEKEEDEDSNLLVNCIQCDKLYCKSHSYIILGYEGDKDMYYCSQECFLYYIKPKTYS